MNPIYIDGHCHLLDSAFTKDLDAVVKQAKESGVAAALVVTISNSDVFQLLTVADRYPDFMLPCCGIHPVQEVEGKEFEQRSVTLQDYEGVEKFIGDNHERLGAIGEIGLDFTPRLCRSDKDKEVQRQILTAQVKLALKYNLPINVHSRSAGRPTISLLKELGAKNVLLHAFDGKPSVAMQGVQEGFYFSIPPCIVRSQQKSELVERLPMENILLETDSPALGPEKQIRNEPKNIRIACEYIAKVKGMSVEEVMRVTTANALRLFPKLRNIVKI